VLLLLAALVAYGSAAAIVVLVGLAFGAGRRSGTAERYKA
jgi:hypothetical protein